MSRPNRMEDEISAIETLLNLRVGYGFEFFGGLISLREQEDHNEIFVVEREKYVGPKEDSSDWFELEWSVSFRDAREAAEFFVNKRNELEIGIEFEGEPQKE